MNHHITADNESLFRQASKTAAEYLDSAVTELDAKFGAGFAAAHPELVGQFMQTCALDLGAAIVARAIETSAAEIAQGAVDASTTVADATSSGAERLNVCLSNAVRHLAGSVDVIAGLMEQAKPPR